jgi:hypothetical protein
MVAGGFDMCERLHRGEIPPGLLDSPLASVGLAAGDVVSVSGAAGDRHFLLVDGDARCGDTRKPAVA